MTTLSTDSTSVVTISASANLANADDIINTITILSSSSKDLNQLEQNEAVAYLKAVDLIEEAEPGMYRMKNKEACVKLSNQLSSSVELLLKAFMR